MFINIGVWLMVNCAVYRFHNIPMKTALHGENMKSSDVHIPVEVLGLSFRGCWPLAHGKMCGIQFFLKSTVNTTLHCMYEFRK